VVSRLPQYLDVHQLLVRDHVRLPIPMDAGAWRTYLITAILTGAVVDDLYTLVSDILSARRQNKYCRRELQSSDRIVSRSPNRSGKHFAVTAAGEKRQNGKSDPGKARVSASTIL
jgi:hypothetical protein